MTYAPVEAGDVVTHFKHGTRYVVLSGPGRVHNSEDAQQSFVLYTVYPANLENPGSGVVWARPTTMWHQEARPGVARFESAGQIDAQSLERLIRARLLGPPPQPPE